MPPNGSLVHAAVPVSLDGRKFVLRYRALAFIRYAEETGGDLLADIRTLGEIGQAVQASAAAGNLSAPGAMFEKVRDICWAGLLDQQPEMTRDEVVRLFGFADFPQLLPAIYRAIQATLPKDTATVRPTKPPKGGRLPGLSIDGSASQPSSATDAESEQENSAP